MLRESRFRSVPPVATLSYGGPGSSPGLHPPANQPNATNPNAPTVPGLYHISIVSATTLAALDFDEFLWRIKISNAAIQVRDFLTLHFFKPWPLKKVVGAAKL